MIEKATNRDLVAGLKGHLEETNKQIERLQKVFEKLGKQPSGTQCPAIDGIIKEADETAGEIEDKAVQDAAIVAKRTAVEHYEMCRYGTLIAWAEELGHDEIVRFLTTNLNEEKAANTKLNTVALRRASIDLSGFARSRSRCFFPRSYPSSPTASGAARTKLLPRPSARQATRR
jgi:ferritin-like metal-binding protein YciE